MIRNIVIPKKNTESGKVYIYKNGLNGSALSGKSVINYLDGKKKYEEEYFDENDQSKWRKVYYEDHVGNIVQIHYYEHGVLKVKYNFTYDGYRNPKHYRYLVHIYDVLFMPEAYFPVWHDQPCNVKTFSSEVYSEEKGWEIGLKVNYEYQYNEKRFPIVRYGVENESTYLENSGEMTYEYKSCQ